MGEHKSLPINYQPTRIILTKKLNSKLPIVQYATSPPTTELQKSLSEKKISKPKLHTNFYFQYFFHYRSLKELFQTFSSLTSPPLNFNKMDTLYMFTYCMCKHKKSKNFSPPPEPVFTPLRDETALTGNT